MAGYKDYLWQMKEGERYVETFLIKKMTLDGLREAIEKGFLQKVGENDIGVSQYTITRKGLANR